MHGENITSSSEQVGAGGEEDGACVSASAAEEEKVMASMRMNTMAAAAIDVVFRELLPGFSYRERDYESDDE